MIHITVLWDILAWLLVGFPLLTGGVWIHEPGLKIEISEIGIPFLIVAALGTLLKAGYKAPLERTTSVRVFLNVWNRWQAWMRRDSKKALLAGALVQTIILSAVSLRRHWSIGSGAADLGIFTNAIWNLTHGNGYYSSVKDGMNLFSDHQSPTFWLFAPAFKVFPYPETLLILQAAFLSLGAIAVFGLGRQYLKRHEWALSALPLLYWAYLPMRNANAFDFHPEIQMLPLFLAAIFFLQSEKKSNLKWGVLTLILALGCKESAPPICAGIGLSWLLGAGPDNTRPRTKRLGGILIGVGMLAFIFDTKIVPSLLGGTYAYQDHYERFGNSIGEILLSPITKPAIFWGSLFGPARLKFLFWTLAPLGFLPLFNPRALVASLPAYLMLFLSSGDHRVAIIYHYAAEPAVGLFWALPLGIELAQKRLDYTFRGQITVALWVVFWAMVTFGRPELYRIRIHTPTAHQIYLREKVIPCINPASTTSSSGALVPHLASRAWAHHLPKLQTPGDQILDCVIFDPDVNNWPMQTDVFNQLYQLLDAHRYTRVFQCGKLEIYQSPWIKSSCLVCDPGCI